MVSLSFLQFLVAGPDLRITRGGGRGVSFGQGVGWGLPGGGGGGSPGPSPRSATGFADILQIAVGMSGIFVILAVSSGGSRPSDNEGGGGGIIRPRGGVGAPRWGGGVRRAPPRDPPLVSKQ